MKIVYTLSLLTMLSGLILSLVLSFWILYPYKTIEMQSPMDVINPNKTVKAGEELFYRAIYKKYTNITPTITRTIVDGIVFTLPQTQPKNTKGSHDQIIPLTIPKFIPEGNYYMQTTACYQVNPIREVCIEYETEKFIVVK